MAGIRKDLESRQVRDRAKDLRIPAKIHWRAVNKGLHTLSTRVCEVANQKHLVLPTVVVSLGAARQ